MTRVAILEDEAVTTLALISMLDRLEYTVCGAAKDVGGFLRLVDAIPVDLVLLDIMVKGDRDGISAAAALRTTSNPAIVYLTTYDDPDIVRRMAATRPNGYIRKPFDQAEVHAALELAMANHSQTAPIDDTELATVSGPVMGGLTPFQIKRVHRHIDMNLHRDVSVVCLAQLCNLSAPHFASQFRRSTEETPLGYLTRMRLEKAKALLRTTGAPISEIALQVGYKSASHFSALFRKETGLSPSRFRNI